MNSKELRLGNYVASADWQHTNNAYPVCEIGEDFITFDLRNNTKPKLHPSQLAGVQITPEWLERMGFNKDDHNDYCRWITQNKQVFVEESPFGYLCCITDEYLDYAFTRPIEYIHQLQNLVFALTREDLKLSEKA